MTPPKAKSYHEIPVPEDLVETVAEWRQKLVESVAEYDDALLEKFFDNPDSITREEMMVVIRQAVIDMKFSPVLCGSAFKNKGVQTMLDAVMAYLPSPLDMPAIIGTHPDTGEEDGASPRQLGAFHRSGVQNCY